MNVHNAGEKWHYAPMATRLAQQGILTCVLQYSLYPEARAQDMVAEVSSALSWTLDNITQYGGNPSKVLLASAKKQLYRKSLCNHSSRTGTFFVTLSVEPSNMQKIYK